MKNHKLFRAAAFALAIPFLLVGCDREVSHTASTKVKSDGSSKTQETVVKQAPDGTVTKQETVKERDSDGDTQSKQKTTVVSPNGTVTKEESTKKTSPPEVP